MSLGYLVRTSPRLARLPRCARNDSVRCLEAAAFCLTPDMFICNNIDVVLCRPGLAGQVLGGRNEKIIECTDAVGHADRL